MGVVSSSQSSTEIQIGLFESIIDLLLIEPFLLLGIVLICVLLIVIFRKDSSIPKVKTSILSLAFYYYLCIMLTHIVGIPTLSEFVRLSRLGEAFFNPNINVIPLSDGMGLGFILNIFLFIPLGFLCPLMSKTLERAGNTFFIGLGLSLFIEIVQLFTLYRATDIDDLITNVIGTMIGYLCFRLIAKLRIVKLHSSLKAVERDYTVYIPIAIIIVAFILGFFS
ncbi:VanZ family protein [Bariatricus massiliensis]|uniref:VanZ family protein n=1 Tax=Bariatricus massiliensis TaxID=1745713 RepID=A0ABS8DIM9_9FIRM|nr:VanZ family protein [Bariatricus massiliensis]MCB7304713.1 VanZ family protein [Bariatricus massiliensis]MCB7374864.1 VanZ family protein [Bariatricus massiliensis]MCB7388009.1 VanZ family protein [Bariatricus massiliensis]MCB7412029.1 VanZ family protein [Bariatricus massiliensis]MCQ5254180.1 VanZ family protein [Bariatricus massiliensis]